MPECLGLVGLSFTKTGAKTMASLVKTMACEQSHDCPKTSTKVVQILMNVGITPSPHVCECTWPGM